MTENERKAAMALAEAQRQYEANPNAHTRALLEVARDHLIAVCAAEMSPQGVA